MTSTLYDTAADLSATAGDIAAAITDGRACPGALTRARRLLDALTAGLTAGFPPVVCLCGSTRFTDEFNRQRKELTEHGEIVLSIEIVTTQAREHDPQHADPALKARLDELHKRKIDLADYVLVLNPGGYIGESTRSEIGYAAAHGKPVRYLHPTWHEECEMPICPECGYCPCESNFRDHVHAIDGGTWYHVTATGQGSGR